MVCNFDLSSCLTTKTQILSRRTKRPLRRRPVHARGLRPRRWDYVCERLPPPRFYDDPTSGHLGDVRANISRRIVVVVVEIFGDDPICFPRRKVDNCSSVSLMTKCNRNDRVYRTRLQGAVYTVLATACRITLVISVQLQRRGESSQYRRVLQRRKSRLMQFDLRSTLFSRIQLLSFFLSRHALYFLLQDAT